MCLNHKHLKYHKANMDLSCKAIWVYGFFSNNIDLDFASANIVISDL